MRAVRFHEFGDTDVRKIEDVPQPQPGPGQVLVRVLNAAINPIDSALRTGHPIANQIHPTTFPSGQGFELSGVVAKTGEGANGFSLGDPVFGYAPRRAQADFAVVEAAELAPKPAALSWAVAASLPTASATAHAAVGAVAPKPGETVVVSAASGAWA